jgi:hypothetical protein
MWATRLPFGFLDSPRLFCGVTEAIAQEVRRKIAARGGGIHIYVFVDDFLVIGDDEALTREGCALLEAELSKRNLQWAPHKERGPCRCIEFLGLLISNVEGARGISISRKRMESTLQELAKWQARRPTDGAELSVDPEELARLLGRLVFVSQVIPHGRTYMQGMLSAFQGLSVDWRRHRVKRVGGTRFEEMTVHEGFWDDVQWWVDHMAARCLTPFEIPPAGEAAITGTDASGWGTGQVAWIDGGREESTLKFTAAEKRRPINWRELLGVVRIVEQFGARLKGRTVLVETDNMAAKGVANKGASKAADMQELVRRLVASCEQHGINLRVTHTPGEKLDRPDQTSRGDPMEEPRVRVRRDTFRSIERAHGPFNEVIGAEREWAVAPEEASERSRLWVHPTLRTVAPALRLLGERLSGPHSSRTQGLALVPLPSNPHSPI